MKSYIEQLETIQRHARLLLKVRAVSLWVAITSGCLFVTTFVDWWFQFEGPILRCFTSITILTILILVALRLVRSIVNLGTDPIQTARWVERSLPELRDELSTAVALASVKNTQSSPNEWSYSNELMRRTEKQLADKTEKIAFWTTLRPAAILPSLLLAIIAFLTLAGIAVLAPGHGYAGVARLVAPLSSIHWPTKNQLRFEHLPQQVAIHSDLVVQLKDIGTQLPRQVDLQVRSIIEPDPQIRNRKMVKDGDRMVVNFTDLRESIQIRAVGGDDKYMPWHNIKVVRPPKIDNLRVIATPPPYLSDSPFEISESAQLLKGSLIQFNGSAQQPLRSATMQWTTNDQTIEKPLDLSSDGLQFSSPIELAYVVEQSTTVKLTVSPRKNKTEFAIAALRIDALDDRPPSIEWQDDTSTNFCVPYGKIPITATVMDDVGIRNVWLKVDNASNNESALIDILTADETNERSNTFQINYSCDLTLLDQYRTNQKITVTLHTEDLKGQKSASRPQPFSLLTLSDYRRRIRSLEQQLLARLLELSRNQQLARESIQRLPFIQLQRDNPPIDSTIETLESVLKQETNFRTTLLTDERSILKQFQSIARHMQSNRIPRNHFSDRIQTTTQQLKGLSSPLSSLIETTLPKMIRDLQLHKTSQRKIIQLDFDELVEQQDTIQTVVSNILRHLDSWNVVQQYAQQLVQMKMDQSDLQAKVEIASKIQYSKDRQVPNNENPNPNLVSTQRLIARRFERLLGELGRTRAEESGNSSVAANLSKILATLSDRQTGSMMRQAVEQLTRNRLLQTSQTQATIIASLDQAIQIALGSDDQPAHNSSADLEPRINIADEANRSEGRGKPPTKQISISQIREIQTEQKSLNQSVAKKIGQQDFDSSVWSGPINRQQKIADRFKRLLPPSDDDPHTPVESAFPDVDSLDNMLFNDLESTDLLPNTKSALPDNNPPSRDTRSREERILGKMLRVIKRMNSEQFDVGLVQLQSEILDDLDKLLDVEPTEQKNQLPNQDTQSPGDGSSENRASDSGSSNQEASKTDLTDSTETFLKRAWGRLPARARKHMPSSQSESFVPGFEKATERYYRKLADSE